MPNKELSASEAATKINTYLKSVLEGKEYDVKDLILAYRSRHPYDVGPNYNDLAMQIWSVNQLRTRLDLSNPEFSAVFGSSLEELLFDCWVITPEEGSGYALQLYNRDIDHVNVAHGVLCSKGLRFDATVATRQGFFNLYFSRPI